MIGHAIGKIYIDNHIGHSIKKRSTYVGVNAHNGKVVLHHCDSPPYHLTRLREGLCHFFRHESRQYLINLVGLAFRKLYGEEVEKVAVAAQHLPQSQQLSVGPHLCAINPTKLGDSLNLGDALPDGLFHAVFVFQHVLYSHTIDFFPVRVFARDRDLLRHIAEDDNHKGQADGQAHRLNSGVEFVSGQEFQVTAHNNRYK